MTLNEHLMVSHVLLLGLGFCVLFLGLFPFPFAKPFLEIVCDGVNDFLKLGIARIFCALDALDGVPLDVGHRDLVHGCDIGGTHTGSTSRDG